MNISRRIQRTCACLVIGAWPLSASAAATCDEKPKRVAVDVFSDESVDAIVQTIRLRTVDGRAVLELVGVNNRPSTLIADSIVITDANGLASGHLVVKGDGRVVFTEAPKDRPRVQIGLTTESASAPLAAQLSLDRRSVLLVSEVADGLPAARAGVKKHDVIVAVENDKWVTQERLIERVQACKPGDLVRLCVVRRGKPIEIVVTAEPYRETITAVPLLSELPIIAELFQFQTEDAFRAERVLVRQVDVSVDPITINRVRSAVIDLSSEASIRDRLTESLGRLKAQIAEIEALLEMLESAED